MWATSNISPREIKKTIALPGLVPGAEGRRDLSSPLCMLGTRICPTHLPNENEYYITAASPASQWRQLTFILVIINNHCPNHLPNENEYYITTASPTSQWRQLTFLLVIINNHCTTHLPNENG